MAKRDLYGVLGVKSDASHAEIRRVFRRRARQCHPDVNPGNAQAAEKFKEIAAAHEILGNEKKRKAYDEFGEAALHTGFDPEQARQHQQSAEPAPRGAAPSGADPGGESFDGFDLDLGDLLGGTGRARRGAVPGEDVLAYVDLDLATALSGTELSVDAPTERRCATCRGTGHQGGTCELCRGKGRIAVSGEGRPTYIAAVCPRCGGRGHSPCPSCHGEAPTMAPAFGYQALAGRATATRQPVTSMSRSACAHTATFVARGSTST